MTVKVMRINKLTTKNHSTILKIMGGDQSGEFVCGSWDLKG